MKNNTVVVVIVTAVIAGGLGFWGGMQYQTSKSAAAATAARAAYAGGAGGNGGFRGGRGGGPGANAGFVRGSVLSMDSQSITVQTQGGGSKIVFYTASTTASKPTDVPVNTVAVGDNVMIMGTPNSDGSVTAQSIQVRPPGTGGPGGAPEGGQQPGAATNANTNAPAKPAPGAAQ